MSIKATSNKGLKKPHQRCHKAYINMIPTRQESHNASIPQSITSSFSKKLHWQDLYQKLILAKALIDWRQIPLALGQEPNDLSITKMIGGKSFYARQVSP